MELTELVPELADIISEQACESHIITEYSCDAQVATSFNCITYSKNTIPAAYRQKENSDTQTFIF